LIKLAICQMFLRNLRSWSTLTTTVKLSIPADLVSRTPQHIKKFSYSSPNNNFYRKMSSASSASSSTAAAASAAASTRFNIAGWTGCGAFQMASKCLQTLKALYPAQFDVTINEIPTRDEYLNWLNVTSDIKTRLKCPDHKTSPLVWFDGDNYLGGRDDTLAWTRKYFTIGDAAAAVDASQFVDQYNPQHGFDYDVVVVGGGSGGLACSKEMKKLGAKVAVLDFVKPSPQGTKWGLGGTCVNVGCIPKKLMHTAALLGEHTKDSSSYGWNVPELSGHSWENMKNNIVDHIKGLNFNYRVQLREQGVTYLNKLGRFVGPNQLECTDSRGKVDIITAARFVIAVGGRPTPLDCPGAEFCISSDDLFYLEKSPGKTCVVGAGYVALECAGFLTGLHQGDVTVLVRSMPLRGFDRDGVDHIVNYMKDHGTKIVEGVTPRLVERIEVDCKVTYRVTLSDGTADVYDTVLVATGRYADLKGLNIEALNLRTDPKSGKLVCINEQTTVPHIYAIGDVVHGTPELTPVAIMAGRLLARRLWAGSNDLMVYKDIATTVFTPLEFGTVGYSEEDAKAKFGEDKIDSYISSFIPLEWSVTKRNVAVTCFSKIVVDTSRNNKIVGMHIAAPNAGEIIQGFGAAFRKGITYEDLMHTVGIHPTIAEEFTTMEISKSSGKDSMKAGC